MRNFPETRNDAILLLSVCLVPLFFALMLLFAQATFPKTPLPRGGNAFCVQN